MALQFLILTLTETNTPGLSMDNFLPINDIYVLFYGFVELLLY